MAHRVSDPVGELSGLPEISPAPLSRFVPALPALDAPKLLIVV